MSCRLFSSFPSSSLPNVQVLSYNHLGILGHADALALDDLDVVQAAENLVLNFKLGAHGELGALLDLEWLVFEAIFASRSRQIDGDGIATGGIHGQRQDDTDTRIVGVGDVFAIA